MCPRLIIPATVLLLTVVAVAPSLSCHRGPSARVKCSQAPARIAARTSLSFMARSVGETRVVSLSDGDSFGETDRCLIAPRHPSFARAAREQLDEWPGTARLDDLVLLIGLAAVLALTRFDVIDLPPSRRERAGVLAAHAEQNQFRYVAEIEADATAIRTAVFADFVPDDVGLVAEAPRLHHREAVGQQRIRAPQVNVRRRSGELCDRQRHDLVERHGAVTGKALV